MAENIDDELAKDYDQNDLRADLDRLAADVGKLERENKELRKLLVLVGHCLERAPVFLAPKNHMNNQVIHNASSEYMAALKTILEEALRDPSP